MSVELLLKGFCHIAEVVVVQFLSGIVSLAEMGGFTPFVPQVFALYFSTLLDSGHPLSLSQSFLSPLSLASSRSSLLVLTFSCHSLQNLEHLSKHYCHPSSAHVHTM